MEYKTVFHFFYINNREFKSYRYGTQTIYRHVNWTRRDGVELDWRMSYDGDWQSLDSAFYQQKTKLALQAATVKYVILVLKKETCF